jgi:hypothetical protein
MWEKGSKCLFYKKATQCGVAFFVSNLSSAFDALVNGHADLVSTSSALSVL